MPYKIHTLLTDNGQVERMNRTLKEATVQRFFYQTHLHFRKHLQDFVNAYNFARRLKTLKGLTPNEYICAVWTKEPQRFKPLHSGTKQLERFSYGYSPSSARRHPERSEGSL